jgi:NDP-sugar pyrophosphorylase family protein
MAILAGGLGTRLGDLCRNVPKALVEVAGCPFIHHQLRLLKKKGFKEIVILAGYLGELITKSVGNGHKFGLKISYSFDWPDLLGTGGALVKALPLLSDKFMVMYGDSYLDLDYQAICKTYLDLKKPALMTIYKNKDNYDKSNVVFKAGVIQIYDKFNKISAMDHIDYCLGCFSASVFNDLSGNFDLADIYSQLASQGQLAGYLVENRFYEIGSLSGLAELETLLSKV